MALEDKRDDEYVAAAHVVVENASGVRRRFAELLIVDFGGVNDRSKEAPSRSRLLPNLLRDAFGIARRAFSSVIVTGFEVDACAQ